MFNKFNVLDTKAKIRIFLFVLILAWCAYCSIAYSIETNFGNNSATYVDTSSIDNIVVDGSDFTWAVLLMGHAVNGMISLLIIFLFCALLVAESILTLIPVLLLRFIGIRKTTEIINEEYQLSKYIYYIAIALSMIIGLILNRFSGLLNLLIFVGLWALIARIYISALKMNMSQQQISNEEEKE